jgi:Ser/Thr protein kinase RdoA (MazF antagonist)
MANEGAASPLTDASQVTARWLTSVLRAGGFLPATGPTVRRLAVEKFRGKPLSTLLRLTPTWDGEPPPRLPASFILKLSKIDDASATARRRRQKEHAFYTQLVPAMPRPPAPRAFAAAWDPRTAAAHLLMEDLDPTHGRPPRGLPPTPVQAEAHVLALADLHAAWWESPDLRDALALRDPDWHARRLRAADDARALLADLGGYLSAGIRNALSAAVEAWPEIAVDGPWPVTVIHGDAHAWNCLTPTASEAASGPAGGTADGAVDEAVTGPAVGPAVLLDWEAWSIEPAATDLTALIAMRFDPQLRRDLEPGLLAAYHARLLASGVDAYPWDAFLADYRRALLRRVMTPVSQWKRGLGPEQWWNNLSRVALAWEEHNGPG